MTVTVKDIIEFLSQYPPETEVILDKNGWSEEKSVNDSISYLIDDSPITFHNQDYLIINN